MIAVDTNVVIRYLVKDNLREAERSSELIRMNPIWIAKSVLLETEWVLRSIYDYSPQSCATALLEFAGLPTVSVEDELAVNRALGWFQQGVEFADALHLASSGDSSRFATFDRKLARQGKKLKTIETIALA